MDYSTSSQTLFFVDRPPLQDLCTVSLTVSVPEYGQNTPVGQQPQIIRCRELIFTEPHIIATPSLNHESKVIVIMQQSLYRTGRLQARFQKMGCQSEKPKRVTSADYQSCLSYTLLARIAPTWNKAGDYLIQGRDFITSQNKLNAVRFDLRVTEEELYFTIVPAVIKSPPAKLTDLGICTPVVREFQAMKPDASIREYSIENKWCHILPSMKKGKVINVLHTIPESSPFKSYKDMKKHWKNTYGYRLPDDDQGLLYYQVYFKLVGEMLFTYPDVCVRPREVLVFPRTDPRPVLSVFLADLAARLPTVCGQPLRVGPGPVYPTPGLLACDKVPGVTDGMSDAVPHGPNLTSSAPVTRYTYRPPVTALMANRAPECSEAGRAMSSESQPSRVTVPGRNTLGFGTESYKCLTQRDELRAVPRFGKLGSHMPFRAKLNLPSSAVIKSTPLFSSSVSYRGQHVLPHRASSSAFCHQGGQLAHAHSNSAVAPSVGAVTPRGHLSQRLSEPLEAVPAPWLESSHVMASVPAALRAHMPAGGALIRQAVEVGPSQPAASKRSAEEASRPAKKRPKVQEDVDVEEMARLDQLGKVNTATLISWLRSKGIPCRSKDKKADLVERAVFFLSLKPDHQ